MPTKFQLITELYDQTVQSVTGSYQSWTGFLRAACYNYKCPFDDQILIYAQRPDATAVLELVALEPSVWPLGQSWGQEYRRIW